MFTKSREALGAENLFQLTPFSYSDLRQIQNDFKKMTTMSLSEDFPSNMTKMILTGKEPATVGESLFTKTSICEN